MLCLASEGSRLEVAITDCSCVLHASLVLHHELVHCIVTCQCFLLLRARVTVTIFMIIVVCPISLVVLSHT